VLQINNTEIL